MDNVNNSFKLICPAIGSDPSLKVNCPTIGTVEANSLGMCLPGGIAGIYYFGATGCFYGTIKSIYTGKVFAKSKVAVGAVERLMAGKATAIAERNIQPCLVESIANGIVWGADGWLSGAFCFGGIGLGNKFYQKITGYEIPNIEIDLSVTAPGIQLMERV
ncbi:hypothetical protein [Endozoicomonas sp. SCSIO W0465]|uniref:hypothetical protein n=1 Tax=Endozoicomonas sp. SCSIO W0465 TaxID=2918516 RepID=UPI002075FAB9|nr:hypothetical protein [Endozoicomonas sp. SCSIO W0465]USE36177.1 hypothetical protein MJO57_29735 [Endozoicomonas sp. SCSIO W0465]